MIWIIWIILGFVVLFFLGTVFYKQTIQEYRINQIDWDNRDKLINLWEERVPIVVRDSPLPPVWTKSDIEARSIYKNLTVAVPVDSKQDSQNAGSTQDSKKLSLRDWILTAPWDSKAVWNAADAANFAAASNFETWIKTIWLPCMDGIRTIIPSIFPIKTHFWAGSHGLHIFKANWTLIFPTESSIIVTLMTEKEDQFLPSNWKNSFPRQYTNSDTPYVSSIQYIDVILRPGHSLWIPAHWKVAWEPEKESEIVSLVCTIDVHSPISWINSIITDKEISQSKPKVNKKYNSNRQQDGYRNRNRTTQRRSDGSDDSN
jgi:hypothetical protein